MIEGILNPKEKKVEYIELIELRYLKDAEQDRKQIIRMVTIPFQHSISAISAHFSKILKLSSEIIEQRNLICHTEKKSLNKQIDH